MRIISLGAGVQSTTVALMAAVGRITPLPDAAIFADTHAEPAAVYEHLRWLRSGVLPFPIHVVSAGNLTEQIAAVRPNGRFLKVDIPAYVKSEDGSMALINRSCTRDYKIDPIRRKVRELLGITGKRSPKEAIVEQWIGISRDEAHRMKPAREQWIVNRWPLIELGMSRLGCLDWLRANGFPEPPRSACTFCPFHNDHEWRALKARPVEWAEAVEVDARLRSRPAGAYRSKGVLYLHRSGVPLTDVDLTTAADRGQQSLFGNECEGVCGV
jgi:hypothetical protein